ncbi:MAG: hypothetical protein JW760_01050 [Spirochaetales bacterium]|nr:hypothetical protein [Spirochaetales bacterium]
MNTKETKQPAGLVSGIIAEAKEEAATLVREAEVSAKRRIEAAEQQASTLLESREKEIAERSKEILLDAERRARLEIHRRALKEQEHLVEAVTSEARRRMSAMPGGKDYREILKGWIAEAGLGLGSEEGILTTSPEEGRYLDGKLLREAEEEILQLSGRATKLTFDPEHPAVGQGVILSDKRSNRAFNNQVSTRLVRYTSALRAVIHKELFTES